MNRRAFIVGSAAAAVTAAAVPAVAAAVGQLPARKPEFRGCTISVNGRPLGTFESVSFNTPVTFMRGDAPLYAQLVRYPEVKFVWIDENGREFSKEISG